MQQEEEKKLWNTVIESIQEKKGKEIVSLDLQNIEHAICDYFIICHADSNTQVSAIANGIEKNSKEKIGQRVWRKTGETNAQWVLLDYGNIVVHIFQTPYREFYKLEELWADAEFTKIDSDE